MIPFSASSVLRSARGFTACAGLGLTTVAACMLVPAGTVSAASPPLPLTSVTSTGDASIQTSNNTNGASAGVTVPGGGNSQYLVTTESVSGDGTTVSGTSAVPVTTLANAMYLDPAQVSYNAGNAGTEGSALEFYRQYPTGILCRAIQLQLRHRRERGRGCQPGFRVVQHGRR